jgi:hypothetical protein
MNNSCNEMRAMYEVIALSSVTATNIFLLLYFTTL